MSTQQYNGYNNPAFCSQFDRQSSPPRKVTTSQQGRYEDIVRHASPSRRLNMNDSTYDENNIDDVSTSYTRRSMNTSQVGHDNLCYDDSSFHHNSPPRRILNASQNGHEKLSFEGIRNRHISPERKMVRSDYEDNRVPYERHVTPVPRGEMNTSHNGHDAYYEDDMHELSYQVSAMRSGLSPIRKEYDNKGFEDGKIQYKRHLSPPNKMSAMHQNGQDNLNYDHPNRSPITQKRIIYREPPIGAATVTRIVEIIPQHRQEMYTSRNNAHRRQGSATSPTALRKLLPEYSPTKPTEKPSSVTRRHSTYIPNKCKSVSSPPSTPSQLVSAITSPVLHPRRITRPLSPPRSMISQEEYIPPSPHKHKIPEPPNENRGLYPQQQQQQQAHRIFPSNTSQKIKTEDKTSNKLERLTPMFSSPNKPDSSFVSGEFEKEEVIYSPSKFSRILSPFSTPKKSESSSVFATPKKNSTPVKPHIISKSHTNMQSPKRSTTVYVMPDHEVDKSTAVVSPIYPDSPSVSASKASWIQMSSVGYQAPPTGTLATVGVILLVCGALSAVLGLYLLVVEGRRYYLDFGLLSGGLSLLLGFVAFRARRWQWLPNRNYVSGYIVLSMFSLLTCAGLSVMTSLRPQPGAPLADLIGGAVCGVTVLNVVVTVLGVLMSQCCRSPPPDNRVEHSVEGFTL